VTTNDLMARFAIESGEKWLHWAYKIPYLAFSPDWQVAIIPPFTGAIIRFRVRTKKMSDDGFVSVYLDCLDRLGCMGKPYYEVYPVENDVFRCGIDETDELMKAIQKSIDSQEKSNHG
jgi:hypothetical protein